MGALNPNGQSARQQDALRAIWEATPQVAAMSADVLAAIQAEGLDWNEAGLTRAFAIMREWEAAHGALPESGIKATG